MKLRIRTAAVGLLVPVLAASLGVAKPTEDELTVNAKINRERSMRSSEALKAGDGLTSLARQHSCEMAAEGRVFHSDNLGKKVKRWKILGENVGQGWDLEVIHQEFMASEHHRSNILREAFTYIGTGVCLDEFGNYWVTQIFFG